MVKARTNIAPPASETADATGLTSPKIFSGEMIAVMAPRSALIPSCARRSRRAARAALRRLSYVGICDRELAHRERGDAGRNETDGKDDHDRRRQCECVPDATPLERADHRPGGEGDEETEHHRDDERCHFAQGEHRDEDEHEPADRRERAGGPDQPVRPGPIVGTTFNGVAARTFRVPTGHVRPP